MKKIKNKKIIFMIILLVVVSSTIAFLYSTDTFQNIFVAASYKVTVTETFESPDNWKPGDTTPKTITLKNEGTIPIKVRVKLEEEWKDSNNQDLPLQYNGENVSIINLSNKEDYIYKEGYYYYELPLNPGETTSSIIESVTFNPNYTGTVTCIENNDSTHTCSSSDSGYEGGTYKLTITMEGVQEDYYVQAWGLSGIVERPYLYNVLRDEAESNGLAREYTGLHQDSMDETKSTEKIYYYYGSNEANGIGILDKNNVIFGGQCWQMLRTTDTGGVKMIYYGEPDNNHCYNTRGTHIGYDQCKSQTLNSNYWYGTDYTYDSTSKLFALSGTTEQTTWNATTGPTLIGKYTCKKTTESGTCSTLYLIESYSSATGANAIPLNSSASYSQFGSLQFNASYNSPTYVGYKYGDVYKYSKANGTSTQNFTASQTILQSASLDTSYWYASSIDYGNITADRYSLVNEYQVSETTDYPNLVGKYTFQNTTQSYTDTSVFYIAAVNDSNMYYKQLSGGNLLSNYEPIIFGDSITDNGDSTYTINNATSVTLSDWYTNYESYKNKYTCNNSSNTCTNPRYTTATTQTNYTYLNAGEKIMIGKAKSGTSLIDTVLVRKDELILNSNNYSDYIYTCNTDNAVCTDNTLRKIIAYSETGYNYAFNYYWGSSVTWDGTNYTLVNPIETTTNLNDLSTHHFICLNYGNTVCTTVGYAYYYEGTGQISYITLKNGITTPSKVMEDMFTKNTTNSIIKSGIDAWYKHYLLEDYDDYIEDTIFCNDRSIRTIGGWDPDGGKIDMYLKFKEYTVTKDLSCTNNTDKFSISNNDALLDYKVGLMSSPEMNILNQNSTRNTGQYYWLISPSIFGSDGAVGRNIYYNGYLAQRMRLHPTYGVRPAISLKPGIEYSDGDGSKENPYIIKMD